MMSLHRPCRIKHIFTYYSLSKKKMMIIWGSYTEDSDDRSDVTQVTVFSGPWGKIQNDVTTTSMLLVNFNLLFNLSLSLGRVYIYVYIYVEE